MTVVVLIVHLLSINTTERNRISGWLSAYELQPTQLTLEYRLGIGDVQDGRAAYIAVADCKRIGETGIMQIEDSHWFDYQVFDCLGSDASHNWMEERNIVAEVDYWTWQKHGLGRSTIIPGVELSKSEEKEPSVDLAPFVSIRFDSPGSKQPHPD